MHWPNAREFHNSVPDLLRVPIKSFFKESLFIENILGRYCIENMSHAFVFSCSLFVTCSRLFVARQARIAKQEEGRNKEY